MAVTHPPGDRLLAAGTTVQPPAGSAPRRLILDTDPGLGAPGADIDDGLAILYALASPELTLESLTIVNGNVTAAAGTANALALLDRFDAAAVPVHVGADQPMLQHMAPIRALFERVLPNAGVPAAQPTRAAHPTDAVTALLDTVLADPGAVTVAAIGPMTNIANAILRDDRFAVSCAEIVMMAGSATTFAQNITPAADFNSYVDPEALEIVLRSGARLRLVGIDQTSRVRMTREHAAALRRLDTDNSRWLADCVDAWIDFLRAAFPSRADHADACFLHDPLTLAAITHPHLLTWQAAHVAVELSGTLTRGQVVTDLGLALTPALPANAVVAVDTDVGGFLGLLMTRLTALLTP